MLRTKGKKILDKLCLTLLDTTRRKPVVDSLVEDEVEMRTFYSEYLSDYFQVETAIDGFDGINMLKHNKYDLILLDIMMPKMDGVGFLQEMKKDPAISHIPVILLTNLGEEEILKKCFELGAKTLIMKSDVLPDQILPVIHKELKF